MRTLAVAALVAVAAGACAQILGFKPPGRQTFEHRAHVIAGVSCVKCHAGIDVAGDTGPLHIPDTATCVSCHQTPHDRRDCSGCHGGEFTRLEAAQAKRHISFDHRSHVAEVRGNCVRCHPDAARDGANLRPPMATCFSCHQHADQWRVRDCDSCHVDLPGEMIRPESHLVHDGDFVREHGVRAAAASDLCESCHSQRFCAGCHGQTVPALPERTGFERVGLGGVHRAGFRSRHAEEARSQPGLCSTCHSPDSCQTCHGGKGLTATAQAPRSPHPAGWIGPPGTANEHGRAAWRNPIECASCHGGAGEALCIGCHRVGGVGGNPHPPGFTSSRSMTDLPCLLCHGGRR